MKFWEEMNIEIKTNYVFHILQMHLTFMNVLLNYNEHLKSNNCHVICYISIVTLWLGDVMNVNAERYAAKISRNLKCLNILKEHEINRKFDCFTCKIKLYFTREHQLLYFHSWLCHFWKYSILSSLGEISRTTIGLVI